MLHETEQWPRWLHTFVRQKPAKWRPIKYYYGRYFLPRYLYSWWDIKESACLLLVAWTDVHIFIYHFANYIVE